MQYISHLNNAIYFGDKVHWRDIPAISEQPSPHHRPVIEIGEHVGWELDEAAAEAARAEHRTFKTDVWQRVTDEEAELLDASLKAASVKHRRMWEDSISIEHDSAFFALLRDEMAAAFGEERADEILAPSEG